MPTRTHKITVTLVTLGIMLAGLIFLNYSENKNFVALVDGYKSFCSAAIWICGAYIAGNVGEHFKGAIGSVINKLSSPKQ